MTDFETAIRELAEAGVGYVVVGGLAATILGSAHLTRDVDIVCSRLRGLVRALRPHAPRPVFPSSWTKRPWSGD